MRKRLLILMTLGALLLPQVAVAQGTLLPQDLFGQESCEAWVEAKLLINNNFFKTYDAAPEVQNAILACAIKTGYIKLWMLPYYISYIANFFIGIAGIISVLFVVLGGFWYMTGGLTDDKEKGKKTITYALIGLAITMLAWLIVNVVQVAVT